MSAQQNIQATNNLDFQIAETPASGLLAGTPIKFHKLLRSIFSTAGQLLDQVDGVVSKELTMVASTPQTFTIAGALDPLGNTVTVARARLVIMHWTPATDVIALVGNAASHPVTIFTPTASGIINVPPSSSNNDGFVIFQAPNSTGMAIVAGTSDQIKVDPQGGAGNFSFLALTCST